MLEKSIIPHEKNLNRFNIHYELYDWVVQSEETVALEIENSIERLEIEKKLFDVYFIVPPSEAKFKNIMSPFYEEKENEVKYHVPGYGNLFIKYYIKVL